MSYEFLYTNAPIAKDVEYNGRTETFYFRRLTAGERIAIDKGQKGTVKSGESSFEIDVSDMHARNCLLLHFACCDENGGKVFKTPAKVHELPENAAAILVAACNEALAENKSAPR